MELIYLHKKTSSNILARASRIVIPPGMILDKKLPLLFHSENFDALAILLKSGYRNRIDLIYIDPPFNSQQIFSVSHKRSNTISRSHSGKTAYIDIFSLESYLEFMRERLYLMRELLSDEGSIYLHIDLNMGHYLKIIMDEVFCAKNFKNDITRIKSNPKNFHRNAYGNEKDMILFYAKNKNRNIFNQITIPLSVEEKRRMFPRVDSQGRNYNTVPVHAPGETREGETGKIWRGILPPEGRHWRSAPAKLDELDVNGLIQWSKNGVPRIKKYADAHKGKKIQDVWVYKDPQNPIYPTEKKCSNAGNDYCSIFS